MRIFTLGKRGINIFLFTLILLTGSSPLLAQENCPIVSDPEQEFCYLSTVADLSADPNGTTLRWYRSQTATNPIPPEELLQDGMVYYAGTESQSCTSSRSTVTATVVDAGPPTSNFGVTFQPCEYSEGDTSTVQDLIDLLQGNEVQIYAEEYDAVALDPNETLVAGENYFAGQRSSATCETSSRLAIRYDPIVALAPDAEPVQTFCQGATVADLQAQGTSEDTQGFRWYSTATSNPPLDPSTTLIDGETYYATQIINRTNSALPPCESMERVEVTVEVNQGDAGEPATGVLCEADVDEMFPSVDAIEDYLLSLLDEGVSQTGTFSPTAEQLAQQYQNDTDGVGDFTTTYTLSAEECGGSVQLTISVIEEVPANAGDDVTLEFNVTDEAQNLYTFLTAEANTEGVFEGYPDGMFDPAAEGPGTYQVTYTVDGTSATCVSGSDSAVFNITVTDCEANAGDGFSTTLCSSEVESMMNNSAEAAAFLDSLVPDDVDQDGTFEPTLNELFAQWQTNPIGTFTTTYTVGEGECTDSAVIEITVVEGTVGNAGSDNTRAICLSVVDETFPSIDEIRKYLEAMLSSDADRGGTFDPTPEELATQYQNAETKTGEYATTYTVGEGQCTDTAELTVLITEDVDAGTDGAVTLQSDDDPVNLFDYLGGSPDAGGTWTPGDGTFDPATDQPGTFTYTVGTTGCQDSATVVVTVENTDPTDPTECAGTPGLGVICLEDVESTFDSYNAIENYLLGLLDAGVPRTGTFSPTAEELADIYNSDEDGLGDFSTTYTLDTDSCEDSVEITVRVVETVDAGTDGSVTLDPDDAPVDLFDYLGGNPDAGGTWSPGDGTFDPATDQEGTFTYTVGSESCQDTATVVVTVENTDPTDPTECAGTPGLGVICLEDVESTFDSYNAIENYLLGLLDAGVPRTGTFSPTAEELADIYNSDEDGLGDFSTTYTLDTDSCEDSVEITVRVVETVDAGTDGSVTLDPDDAPVDLFDYLGGDPDAGGTWSPGDGTFDPATDQEGTFTYTVGSESCKDTATVVVTVEDDSTEPEVCNAGDDISLTLCTAEVNRYIENPDEAAAFFSTLIDEEADTNGTFDPSLDELLAQWSADPVGTFTTTYTVTGEECEDTATIEITVLEGDNNAGGDNVGVVCSTEVDEMFPSVDEIRKYLLSLLDAGVSRTGSFSPTASQLANQFQNDADGLGEFTTTYTVGTSGPCTDSALITVNVVAPEPANAGPDMTITLCTTGEAVDLTDFLSEEADLGGSFEELENNIFDPAEAGAGSFDFTYSVDATTSCVEGEDSAVYTVVVSDEVNAGADASITLCNSDVASLTPNGVRNLYLDMLEEGVATDGVFNPTIQELIDQYNLQSNFGDFTTVYTVGSGECTDAVELTVTVLENPDAGTNGRLELEEGATETEDLFAALGGTPDEGGVWTDADGNEVDATFDPTTEAEGVYTYTVSSENGCSDSATVTVVIGEPVPCPEITEPEQEFCLGSGATVADLAPADVLWYDSADGTEPLAEDTELVDGGVYFAGDPEGQCIERSSVTVTISEVPVSPSVTDFTDCVITGATVADLDIVGDDGAVFTVYSDETLETVVAEDEVLVSGVYYVTQSTAGGCESEAAELTVTLDDTDAPTFTDGGNVFCEFDDATLADLEESVVGDGEITWYATATGTEPLSTAEMLENNVTYYAAITGESGCESSERLPVTVTLEDCEVVIPEAFSPNGDGINDSFVIENLASEYPDFRLEIYNRWGEPVYTGNASTPEWNGVSTEGSFGSGVVPAGVYFYILYYNDGQTAPTQGRLYLSR